MDNPLVQPDPGLFIWTIVTFLVLLALLAKFAWRPLLTALDGRRQLILKAVEDAERARVDIARAHQDALEILQKARLEGAAMVSRTRADADLLREELRQKAMADAAGIVQRAEKEIQLEANRAVEQLRRESVELSVAIASKLLRRNVTPSDTQVLLDETIRQIETIKH
jgi:F-type H+-transporting ATPase subunit b